jgi:YfiH family protein
MRDFAFLSIDGQISAFSPRLFQNMSLFYGDTRESLTNRKSFLSTMDIDYRDLVCAKQIHSSCARYVKEEDKGKGALSYDSSIADTDALVTDKRNLPLAVFTADCLSIFLYDPDTPAIGLIHAGWRSTKENITDKAIQLMQGKFNTKTSRLYVGFGPAIRSCCCEVGEDFNDLFPRNTIKRNNRYYLDLAQINKRQVLDLGVEENNILDSKICTCCHNKEFFSYRKEGNTCGRLISVIMLK